ncbi:MAG: hypothetical protein K6E29_07785 [Cyanobacteria bacterium RUI128]|nr:hypothetical protein [Cyanobacteria bacterium RUI128]
MDIKRINEELERILEEDEEIIGGLRLVPHGNNAVKYYSKAKEYFKNNMDMVKKGYVNLPIADLNITDSNTKTLGYEFI